MARLGAKISNMTVAAIIIAKTGWRRVSMKVFAMIANKFVGITVSSSGAAKFANFSFAVEKI